MRALGVLSILVIASGAGCQDYFVGGQLDSRGKGEPQPLATPSKTDRIVQSNTLSVDVLWVVDNSCSMGDNQTSLRQNFPSFIDMFIGSDLDWHVGLVSTTTENPWTGQNGKLYAANDGTRYLDPTMPDADVKFGEMVKKLGVNGSGTESGLLAAFRAIAQPGDQATTNAGFYREDAALHIVVVSDEEDQSNQWRDGITVPEFITWLQDLKPLADIPITFSSIVTMPGGGSCGSIDETAGTKYLQVTQTIGGVESDICTGDWNDVLQEIGEKASGRRREFFLSEVPVEHTIDVLVKGKRMQRHGVDLDKLPAGRTVDQGCKRWFGDDATCFPFTYDPIRNSVQLTDWMPNPLDSVEITYDLLSGLQQATDVIEGDTD
jgi:hypothetical protein